MAKCICDCIGLGEYSHYAECPSAHPFQRDYRDIHVHGMTVKDFKAQINEVEEERVD